MPFESERRELKSKVAKLIQHKFAGDYQAAFDCYDTQPRDGKISKAELVELLSDADIGNWITRGQWADGIIAELDTDQDGSISWSEFNAVLSG
jgi:Ca2+-binding EF-hand superfamily protein